MFALRCHDPAFAPAAPLAGGTVATPDEALRQAIEDASAVPGAYARAPWAFRTPTPEAERHLDSEMTEAFDLAPGGWIVVTCLGAGDDAEGGHLRERTLTAVQRFMLSLAADDVGSVWVDDGLPEALEAAMDLGARDALLGVVRWHAG